jgi:hypothetical protein
MRKSLSKVIDIGQDKKSIWITKESKKYPGRYYYYNTSTEESTWNKPKEFHDGQVNIK